MTDRVKGCWVLFDKDIRVDDVEQITDAIKMIKGVQEVQISVADFNDWANRNRIKAELRDKFWQFYQDNFNSQK